MGIVDVVVRAVWCASSGVSLWFALACAGPAFAQSTYPLTVNLAGSGTVTSSPRGVGCNVLVPTCGASFPAGTTVTLTAGLASVGTTFAGWSGACSGQQSCTVVMSGPETVTATFSSTSSTSPPAPTVSLSLKVSGSGAIFVTDPASSLNSPAAICVDGQANCTFPLPGQDPLSLSVVADTGWVFAGWGGACSGIATCQFTLDQPTSVFAVFTPACAANGENGWWFSSVEPGRGFFIDNITSELYFVLMGYDAAGNATWYAGTAAAAATGCTYSGALYSFAGGQTLTGAFQAPTSAVTVGSFSLTYIDATHADLELPGKSLSIQRFVYASNGDTAHPQGPANPVTGIYWNYLEPGRGFAIEVQNDELYIGSYMYGANGDPVWYVSGPLQEVSIPFRESPPRERCCVGIIITPPTPPPPQFQTSFVGKWVQYGNGQSLGGSYRTPSEINYNVGTLSLGFGLTDTPNLAYLILPDGRELVQDHFLYQTASAQMRGKR
jgi:hypothetical protein